ncbi:MULTISPECIES: outer membrane protein assembly factor BamA [unclassified Pseudomonas]|jgi:outer membrane protein insertion porin family|uniref:outer membrane protein assembly factor BamA n=1 Tax=unclassified Pseudomonas TaxID=196821 RepID=UPI000C822577|nr:MULTISPECIES: outer membrane protein assembly factor BamA [unclassified Pseudomonas]MDP9061994.1 outer membrane protein assembly factor BamA [Pseudomonadota bacterium]AUO22614.1 outer membrane protein assembly factor BamA [Pseudomonas sp. NC02]MBT1266279.1 outer membrane protein assembly factor BamA [Pseudomonas sp. VS38]MDE1913341.1 outer membrane protein assembly factor BamA [Pseudomonas sp.]MDE2194775.1 outer membrane protein assembly factor BamA [Pseudomonas sp.]
MNFSRLLCSVALLLNVTLAHAEAFKISDIRINGLQRVSAGSVFGALPLNVGDEADDRRLVDSTRALFKTGFFQDIQLSRDGTVLIINVVERPSVSSIEFEGNKAISTEDLLKGMKQSGLAEGEIFQRATLEGMRNELQRQYVAQGRYSATVDTEVLPQPRNRVGLKVKIDEGSVAAIQHINVVGNHVFTDKELIGTFTLKTSNWLSFFTNDDKYAREKLTGDLERLRSYYLDRGYINMDITSTQVSITPDKKHVYITVNINEGEKYTVRDVKLSGDLKVPQDQLEALLLVQKGQVFSRKLMTTTSDLITRRLGNDGYTFANVNGMPTPHDEDHSVDIVFAVDPGKRAYVNRINFRGNTKTDDQVLRREMRQMEGGWASTYLIDQSKVRLERLGFFKEVNVETPAVAGVDDQLDVNYAVEEQASGSITASVGFAQDAGLILGGSITQNNFLGTGDYASLGLTRSQYQSKYNIGFTNPYFTPDGVSLGYNAFYSATDYNNYYDDGSGVSYYSINSYGLGATLGYPINETSRLSFGLTVQHDSIDPGIYSSDEIYDFLQREGSEFTNFKANLGWSESTLNKGVMPTRGYSQNLNLTVTLPGSDLSFYKLDYSGQTFVPITNSTTLRLHTKLGYANGYGSTDGLPFYENYTAGGEGSVRGFESGTLGPRSTPATGAYASAGQQYYSDRSPEALGGNILITGGAEYLFPMPFLKDNKSVRTSVFWDVGNVYSDKCALSTTQGCNGVDLSQLGASVGVGATWYSPLGPLSINLALPVRTPENATKQVFQFSMGQNF